ncbi:MAG TPA: TetR/AcrR family transcriptional regulator [Candidatus Synoicihabitans sp.]|nr:TetR/AcrR family transcriptional regulator [Candidatus Synoicihabitans sp.]
MSSDSPLPVDPAAAATRERLLDAAEQLFADHGFDGASLRVITERAAANLAAVNYHFKNKEALYQEVFLRRVRPMNEERFRRLAALESAAGGGAPSVALLLDILLRPIVQFAALPGGRRHPFARLMTRNLIEPQPFMREVLVRELGPLVHRIGPLLRRALPQLDLPTLLYRVRYIMGATNLTFAAVPFPPAMQELLGAPTAEQELQHLISVAEAVLRAPHFEPAPAII